MFLLEIVNKSAINPVELAFNGQACYTGDPMKTFTSGMQFETRLVRFRDGDTAQVEMAIGFDVVICRGFRLLGIESWEHASSQRSQAEAAALRLTELYGEKRCVAHVSTRGFDCYGRLRGHLIVDGKNVADEIVKLGLAWYEKRRA